MADKYVYLFFIVMGYMMGGVLFSYTIPKLILGVDVTRLSDDHNPGATNALKHGSLGIAVCCILCDIMKGFIPIFLCLQKVSSENLMFACVLVAPVLGHATAPLYNVRGGKAIAVSFGVLLGMIPHSYIVFVLAIIYITIILVLHKLDDARKTMISYGIFSVIILFTSYHSSVKIGCTLLSLIVIHKHLFSIRQIQWQEDAVLRFLKNS